MSEQPPKSPPRRAPRPPSPAGSTPRKTAAGKSATTSKATPTETTRPRATPAAARKPRSTVSKQPVAASPVPTQKVTPPPAAKPVRSAAACCNGQSAALGDPGAAVIHCACPARAQAHADATGRCLHPRHARDRMVDLALAGRQARTRARVFRADAHGSPGRCIAAAVADLVGPVVCRRRFSADWHSHHLHPGRGGDARRRLRDQRLCRSLLAGCPCRTHARPTDGRRSRVQARSPAVVRGPAGVWLSCWCCSPTR
jgi:hypothetical protein